MIFDTDHAACKINPANPAQTLAALTFSEKTDDSDAEGNYDLEVLVANTKGGKIISHLYKKTAITSDAVSFDRLELDTARYQITPKWRAFGVRAVYEHHSSVTVYSGTDLTLYVLDGPKLRQVMGNLAVEENHGESDGNCNGDFTYTQRTLAMGEIGQSGFAKLDAHEKTTTRHSARKGDECTDTESEPTITKFTLDYTGNQYGVPNGMSFR